MRLRVRESSCVAIVALAALVCLVLVVLSGVPSTLTASTDGNVSSATGPMAVPSHTRSSEAPSRYADPPSGPAAAAAPALSLDGQSPAAIGLSWTDTTTGTFTNYTVLEASQMSSWAYSTAAVITNAGTTTDVVSGVSPGGIYDWEVQENYQTCVLFRCTTNSVTSNVLNLTQPTVAYLNATGIISTSATLNWNNNATYSSLIAFQSYAVWDEVNGGSPALVTTISSEATTSYGATLLAGTSYSFLIKTSDCVTGCGGGSPSSSVTQSNLITLGTPQTLSVTVFAQHTTIDLRQSDYFTCTPNGGESPFSYSWNFATGSYVPGNASESVVLSTVGTVTVHCEITDAEPSTASSSVIVQVNPPLGVTVAKNRTSADVGQSIAFTCSVVNGTTPYSISWTFGDGSTSTLASPPYAYASPGNYAPTCLVSDSSGAEEAPSTPIVISPMLDARATASSVSAAPGTVLEFRAAATNGSGTYPSYTWNFGSGVTGTGAQVNHSFSSAQNSPITVIVTDSNGASATGTVTVNVSAIVISETPLAASIATGKSVTFTASAVGGAGGPYNFTWTFGDGTSGYGASAPHAYAVAGKEVPSLVVTDRLGASKSTQLPAISVFVPPGPFAWFTGWVALGIAIAIAVILVLMVLVMRRRTEAAEIERAAPPYIPPTNPKETIFGAKKCAFCGTTNLPVRTTCRNCGKPLARSP
jgi:hypothetical protein